MHEGYIFFLARGNIDVNPLYGVYNIRKDSSQLSKSKVGRQPTNKFLLSEYTHLKPFNSS